MCDRYAEFPPPGALVFVLSAIQTLLGTVDSGLEDFRNPWSPAHAMVVKEIPGNVRKPMLTAGTELCLLTVWTYIGVHNQCALT